LETYVIYGGKLQDIVKKKKYFLLALKSGTGAGFSLFLTFFKPLI
jgi:hypothetical protein